MSLLGDARKKYETPRHETGKTIKSPSAGFAGPHPEGFKVFFAPESNLAENRENRLYSAKTPTQLSCLRTGDREERIAIGRITKISEI